MITSTLFEDRVTECGGNFENKKRNHREVLKKSTLSYKSFQNKLTTLTFNLGNETNVFSNYKNKNYIYFYL